MRPESSSRRKRFKFLPNGVEYVVTLLAANLCLALAGAGMLAVDNIMRHKG